jgi:hypothetical protein
MGADLTRKLQQSKIETLHRMVENIEGWDGKAESGIALIDRNEKMVIELKRISGSLEGLKIGPADSVFEAELLTRITEGLRAVIEGMLQQKEAILSEEKKEKQKENLVSRYIKRKETSRFIDKKI